jgi:hypothetical protein
MNEGHTHEQEQPHEHAAPAAASFRFESFADAPSAQAAFENLCPLGSSIEPAVKILVDMGAQCKSVTPGRIACRYVETDEALASWCWCVVLQHDAEKAMKSLRISLAILGA